MRDIASPDLPALSRLLEQALDFDDSQLGAWLAGLAAADMHLAPLLREVLESRSRMHTSDLLTAASALPRMPRSYGAAAGEQIGAYKLLRELGHGGMGTVWLAERADGSFQRQVAIKLPRLAWDDRLAGRMARERTIGALLEHPNIARLYDAGVDPHGRPFLALEFIDGQAIDAWCDERDLGVRERLRLVVQVAQALTYAHGRLVVHRDIKPSNVLVSADGQVHLLDFGIAKLLDEDSNGGADLTREQGRPMTPPFASPEQVNGQVITVASDVYSLGVLLYVLLTGQGPYLLKRNTVGALEEAMLGGEPALASSRATQPERARQLRGDIDAILCVALRYRPAQRYASAEAFAADIERHLRGDVVLARPDSFAYRAGKMLRRHALGVATGSVVLLAVLMGTGVALLQARRANIEAERARLVKEFVLDIFNTRGGADGSLGQMPGHALLERSAGRIEGKFTDQPLLQAELYAVVSDMFFSIANSEQAVNYAQRQVEALKQARADPHQVARALLRVVDFMIPMDAKPDIDTRAREAVALSAGDPALQARAHASLAHSLMYANKDLAGAKREVDAARALVAQGAARDIDRAWVTFAYADWLAFSGRITEARQEKDKTIALALAAEGPTSQLAQFARLETAKDLLLDNQSEAGKAYLAAALQTMRTIGGANDVNAALWEARGALWLYLNDAEPFDKVRATYERSLASLLAQKWWSPDNYIALVQTNLAKVLMRWGNIEAAVALMNQYATTAPQASPLARWWDHRGTAMVLTLSDRALEAPSMVRQMLQLQKAWQSAEDLRKTYDFLVLTLVHAQRLPEAEQALAEYDALSGTAGAAGALPPSAQPQKAPPTGRLLLALATGRHHDVVAMTAALRPRPAVHADEMAWLARATALCAMGRATEAQALFDEWLPRLAHDRYEANPQVAYWRARMGLCALAQGQRQRAREALELARAALARQPGVSGHFKAPVQELRRRLQR